MIVDAGSILATRFNEKGGYLHSYVGDNSVFIDTMMNVAIILYAARETGDRKLRDIALRHARTTRRHQIFGECQRATRFENVVDQYDIAVTHIALDIFQDLDLTGRNRRGARFAK